MVRKLGTYLFLLVAAFIVLAPFAYLVCASVKTSQDYFSSLFLPHGNGLLGVAWNRLTLEHYRRIFSELDFGRYITNSLFLSSVTSVVATVASAMGGYALARFRFRARRTLEMLVIGSLLIPTFLLVAPAYQMLFRLGLLDTVFGVILPAMAPPFGVYLFRQAIIGGVSTELLDAARIDGCGEIRIFFRVVLPLVQPTVGAFMLIVFLGMWNNYITPQVILRSPERFPLSVIVAQFKGVYAHDYGMLMAGTIISVLPVMLLFLLLQRDFIAGLTAGAVKG
jgi:multiple sugar transport system permease protein